MFNIFRKQVEVDVDHVAYQGESTLPPEFQPQQTVRTTVSEIINRLDAIEAKIDKLLENEN